MKKILIVMIMIGVLNGIVFADTCYEMKYDLSDFTEVTVEEGVTLYLTQGDAFSVTAKASHQNLDNLDIRLDEKCLMLGVKDTEVEAIYFDVYIVVPKLNKVTSKSGATVYLDLEQTSLELHGSSGSKIMGEIDMENLIVETSSSAEVILNGTCDHADIEAHVASKVFLTCTEKADVNASVASCVEIYGDAEIVSTSDFTSHVYSMIKNSDINDHQMTSSREDLINSIIVSILETNENIEEGSDEINQIRESLEKSLNK